jgi:hypothetical protein
MKMNFVGTLQTRELPQPPKNANKFFNMFKGARSASLHSRSILYMEKQREALRRFHEYLTVCEHVDPDLKLLDKQEDSCLNNPIVWPYEQVESEFALLVQGANQFTTPATAPPLMHRKWQEVTLAIMEAAAAHPSSSDEESILIKNGWLKKSEGVWENHSHPGYRINVTGNIFNITKGGKEVQPKTPMSKLAEVLTQKKQDGTLPGSITNSR